MQYVGGYSCGAWLINDDKDRFQTLNHTVAFRDLLDILEQIPYKDGNISIETIP